MSQLDLNRVTTTDLNIQDTTIDSESLDVAGAGKITYWTFPNASTQIGLYKNNPEYKKAVDKLAVFTVGQGYETDPLTQANLDRLTGWGEDSALSIFWNMQVMKKVIGDSFAEVIREGNNILNLKTISAERMKIGVNQKGIIVHYVYINNGGKEQKISPENMLHLCNDRIGDEIHGAAASDSCGWVLEALHEVRTDHRKVMHRNVVPLRIIEVDTDNKNKRDALTAEYKEAITKGEVLVIPKGTLTITSDQITITDPMAWISYLENLLYQAVGVPRVIATSEGQTEAGGKVSYFAYEPIYTWEQKQLEADLLYQLGWKIEFNKPASLKDNMQSDEAKNAGQVGIQPNDTQTSTEIENG